MTVQLVARDLLTRGPGDRIPTALQYQHLTGVGSGTVQKALRTLQSTGAVSLRSRGHAGTILVQTDLPRLSALAALGAPTAVLPVPTSPELMGLARVLRLEVRRLGIPFQALYTYGSSRRLALLESGEADFTALSATAAEEAVAKSDDSPLMLIAGGSGVVPLRSMLRHRQCTGSEVPPGCCTQRALPAALAAPAGQWRNSSSTGGLQAPWSGAGPAAASSWSSSRRTAWSVSTWPGWPAWAKARPALREQAGCGDSAGSRTSTQETNRRSHHAGRGAHVDGHAGPGVDVDGHAGPGVDVDGHAGRVTARRFAYQTDMAWRGIHGLGSKPENF
jgi:YhfZ C-terminal domain/Helix-turn-helix domain